jgi:RHS repeat-associated protein
MGACGLFAFGALIPILGHAQTAYTFPAKPTGGGPGFVVSGFDSHCGSINVTTSDFESAFAALKAYTFACQYLTTLRSDTCTGIDPSTPSGHCEFVYFKVQGDHVGGFIDWGFSCPFGTYDPAIAYCTDATAFNAPKNNSCPAGAAAGGTNPCSIGTGNKYQLEVDYRGSGIFPLVFSRRYASMLERASTMGRSWRHSYDTRLTVVAPVPGEEKVRVERPDGREYVFVSVPGGWIPDADVNGRLQGTADGWLYTDGDGGPGTLENVEFYDLLGRLRSITNRAGLTQTLTYSDASTPNAIAPRPGLLIRVTDPVGRSLDFSYDSFGRVVRMSDPAGGVFQFAYDATGQLASVTDPLSDVRTYHYNEFGRTGGANLPGAMTGITDENNRRFATWQYDAQGRVVSSEHAGGANRVTIAFNGDSTSSVTDSLNRTSTLSFGAVLGVVKNTAVPGPCAGCGSALTTSYDANGNVASRTDFNGNRTNYTYDLTRNLETSRTEGLEGKGGRGRATPQSRMTSTQWHATFRLPTTIAEPLRITTLGYDASGNMISKSVQPTSDANGEQGFSATPGGAPRTWTYTYNSNGFVLKADGPRTDVADLTTYTYYANDDPDPGKRGNVASITNAAGHVTSITAYNAHGQPLTIVDPNGLTTTLTYDARQRLTIRTVGGETTSYDHDGMGQLTKVTLPDGSFVSYTYDGAHRLTGMQDNLGNRIAYTLDAMGNRTLEEVRDPANQLAQTRSRVFDNLNRLFRELGAQSQTTEYAYDNQGNVISVTDPLNRITSNEYDALNRLTQVTSPPLTPPKKSSAVTQYAYNGLDALTQVTDARKLVTRYTVDGLGNLTRQASPDTGTTVNAYDAAGNLLTQTDAKSQTTTFAYDALNRVTLITFHDASKQSYAYDQGANGIGRLFSITETNPANQVTSVIAYAYDQHGRVTSETRTVNAVQYVLAYRYDGSSRLDQLTYPSGRTVNYAFDGLGRVSGVTTTKSGGQPQAVVSSVAYHPFGGVKDYTLGNGQVYTRGVDLDGRISSYVLGSQSFAIGYDAASRISFITDIGNPANSNTYGYDNLDRLTAAVLPGTPYAYGYDEVGNRTSRTAGSATDDYTYGRKKNHIASIRPSSGPIRRFAFDANGATTADGLNTYTYDVRGRMVQATSTIGVTSYQVNALGQRIRKTNSQTDRVFHYDTRGRLIAETDPAGGAKREFIYLGDMPVGVVAVNPVAAQLYFVYVDHLNTPRLVADATGTTIWRWDHQEPFGSNPPDENPSGLGAFEFPLRFGGWQYADKETNLSHNYRRDYDPSVGRHPQSDPAGLGGGVNAYAYVDSDPLGFFDPLGASKQRAAPNPANSVTPISNAYANYLINQIQRINPAFQYQIVSGPGQGGYTTQNVQHLSQVLQQLRAATSGINCAAPILYGPVNPGALSPAIANTFRSGTYFGGTLSQPQTMYRVIGPSGNPAGSYWSPTPPAGPLSSVISNALLPQWGNTATQTVTATIPAGTTVYFGVVAAQGGLVGGGTQVYIPQVNPAWITGAQ